jgi:HD-like signal output (HDOD) protein
MEEKLQKILFVDDEKNILSSLRRLFIDYDYDLYFASSADEGLEILQDNDIDMILSDVRMPFKDGITFLGEVKILYPQIVRIFLSGYADREAVMRAFAEGCAQQLIPKPWDEEELKSIVAGALHQAKNQKKKIAGLQKIINSLAKLPPMPSTYMQAKKYLTGQEEFSVEKVAAILENDISISAELIRWANSALFGQRSHVDSVKRAIIVLGSDIVEGLILSGSVFANVASNKSPLEGFNQKGFHSHSVATGILAKKLIQIIAPGDLELQGQAFTAGLLHDLGKLIEESFLHDDFQKILALAKSQQALLIWAEKEKIGTTHEEIGSHLAEWWSMPSFLVNTIRWHHSPSLCNSDKEIIGAVHVANVLVQQFQIGASGNFCLHKVNRDSWDKFHLSDEKLGDLQEAVIQAIV